MYYRAGAGLGLGLSLGRFGIGVMPKLFFDGWNQDAFDYGDGTISDPYFNDNDRTMAFTLNSGMAFDLGRTKIGVLAENIVPVQGSESAERDALSQVFSLGSLTRVYSGAVLAGAEYDMNAPEGKELSFNLGLSHPVGRYVLLGGQFMTGKDLANIGVAFEPFKNISIAYTFEYPFSDVGKKAQSHRISISGTSLLKPPSAKPNLSLFIRSSDSLFVKGETAVFDIIVKNDIAELPKEAQLLVFTDRGDTILSTSLMPSLSDSIKKSFSAVIERPLTLTAVIDPKNRIKESNEADNRAVFFADTMMVELDIEIWATPGEIVMEKIHLSYQDETLVPRSSLTGT
jgi:hypothetical protein